MNTILTLQRNNLKLKYNKQMQHIYTKYTKTSYFNLLHQYIQIYKYTKKNTSYIHDKIIEDASDQTNFVTISS